jgi:hypothetical protein
MVDQLATVASYSRPIDAQLAKAQLEARGIPSFLRNEASASIGGGTDVDLQVPAEYVQAASELLGTARRRHSAVEASAPAGSVEELERCLICRSTLAEPSAGSLLLRILRGIVLQLVPLPPQWLESRRRTCATCGHEWVAGSSSP